MLGWNSLYGPIPSGTSCLFVCRTMLSTSCRLVLSYLFHDLTLTYQHLYIEPYTQPIELAKLTQLTVLDLSCNKLNGHLDETIFAGLIHIQYLNLSCNQLSGIIPSEMFADWSQLIELNLSQNKFTGSLPNSLSCMTTLEVLRLYNNEFTGSLIPSLCDLNLLRSVNLSRNKLNHGSYVLYTCVHLVELQLNDNLFHDYLPSSIGGMPELQLLYLQNNLFHGSYHTYPIKHLTCLILTNPFYLIFFRYCTPCHHILVQSASYEPFQHQIEWSIAPGHWTIVKSGDVISRGYLRNRPYSSIHIGSH